MATKKRSAKRAPREHRTVNPVSEPAPPPVVTEVKVEQPVAPPPEKKMKPIWYMVGLMLLAIGTLVFLAGVYYLVYPPPAQVVMAHLQPDLWWGALMICAGLIFVLTNRKSTVG